MKLLAFAPTSKETRRLGAILENRVLDLPAAFKRLYNAEPPDWLLNVEKFLLGREHALDLTKRILSEAVRAWEEIQDITYEAHGIFYLPPLTDEGKILCAAVNYAEHAGEIRTPIPEEPYFFVKLRNNVVGHRWPVLMPRSSNQVDHEVELAVIIGRKGKYISPPDAYDYVAGYTVLNDMSFRDRGTHKSPRYRINWLHLKNLDTSAPLGPWLVTRDEIQDPGRLKLTLTVNSELRQVGSTEDMIFKIPDLITYVSNGITLMPGDIISTGTPAHVGRWGEKFLNEGDVMTAEVEGIGGLVNPLEKES